MSLKIVRIRKFFVERSGTTSVEYAIMLALILMLCFTAIASFGQANGNLWGSILTELNTYW